MQATYSESIAAATAAYYSEGWEFATVVGEDAQTDVVTLANYLDGQYVRYRQIGRFHTANLTEFPSDRTHLLVT